MRKQQRRGASPAMWLIAGLLGVIAVCLVIEVGSSIASARQAGGVASGDSVLVVAGQITRDSYGLYLVDLESKSICVYQWLGGPRKLRLMAARSYVFDRKLDEYNTEPSPREIKELVEQARRLGKTAAPAGKREKREGESK